MSGRVRPVALLAIDYPPSTGGIQNYLAGLVATVREQGEEVIVFTPTPGAPSGDGDVIRVRPQGINPAARLALNLVVAVRAVKRRPRVVLCGHLLFLPAALVVGRLMRSRVVCFIYAAELHAPRSAWLARILLPRCDRIIAISHYTAEEAQLIGVARSKLSILHPAITPLPDRARPAPAQVDEALARLRVKRPYLLTLARVDDGHKGHDVCIEALATVLESHPSLTYVVAGDGQFREHLTLLAKIYGVEDAVRIVGRVSEDEKHALLSAATSVVLMSRQAARNRIEGFGIVVLEAAQYGVPAVVTRSGGLSDAVDGDSTGWFADPTDVDAVAEALLHPLENGAAAKRGEAAQLRLHRSFTWDARRSQIRDVFTDPS